ncbi:MAG: peptidase C39 family protein [Candidatus Aenigmatarchaeota archaeon]
MKDIPFYKQSTGFTCDPSCLMMAMNYFCPKLYMTRELEMEIWRESNLITVLGCLPQGLAYSAMKRGFGATIVCKLDHMIETTELEGEAMEISLSEARILFEKALELGVKVIDKIPDVDDIAIAMNDGVVLVLVDAEPLHGVKSPHWIIVSAMDECVHINDPFIVNGKDVILTIDEFNKVFNGIEKYNLNKRLLIITNNKI